ncbi:hypothetical protein Pse7367_1935 [Thalassoporum mexicanum PCC 7367]|uniref:hypothetical protein n=1 Tax=Thalassoporum mexicanum TaxID=3457544 RepID=UPI00029FF574|nr:hypothetical protein [Pseudanabaena sp. PCC 7367]AFY70210.1 hypothetical protein Pse7367_1935 [Pseudanabaena sp. PCC 7367]
MRLIQAFIKLNRSILQMPLLWQLWILLLVIVNAIVPLFFLSHLEAQVVVAAFLASFILMIVLTARYGFTRILGLGHIFWIPLLFFLGLHQTNLLGNNLFDTWMLVLIILNSISLIIDIVDVSRYINGERYETIQEQ